MEKFVCRNYKPYDEGFQYGQIKVWNQMNEHCDCGHSLIGYDFRSCLLLENIGKIERKISECTFQKCPLIKKLDGNNNERK